MWCQPVPSAELICQWPLLWDAKTQWLLFAVCISAGVRRKALVQLGGGFPYSRSYQRGKGFSPLWSVIPTLCLWCMYQGKHPAGDGVGAWRGWGAGHGVGARVAPAGDSGRVSTATWLTLLCAPRHGCSPLLPDSPLQASAKSFQGQRLQKWAQSPQTMPRASLCFVCVWPFLPCASKGISYELGSQNADVQGWEGC